MKAPMHFKFKFYRIYKSIFCQIYPWSTLAFQTLLILPIHFLTSTLKLISIIFCLIYTKTIVAFATNGRLLIPQGSKLHFKLKNPIPDWHPRSEVLFYGAREEINCASARWLHFHISIFFLFGMSHWWVASTRCGASGTHA